MSIRIIVDSASDISEQEALSLGIKMIPMIISIGDDEYMDGVNLLPHQFYEKLIESDALPKTSQINSFRFSEVMEECVNNGDDVIVITISSKLSGTYQNAVLASLNFPNKVYVVDSLNACIGERLLVLYALELVKKGMNAKDIFDELNSKKKDINVIALLNTLEYLKKGGRISKTVAFAGEIISLKPVIGVIDGEVKLIGKAIGSKRANNLLNSLIAEKGIDFNMPYGVVYSGLDDSLLIKYMNDSSKLWKENTNSINKYMIGSTIGTHIGPGGIGVAFFKKNSN